MSKNVLIIGATGNFGLEIRKYLLANTDYYLTLISRHAEKLKTDSNREVAVNVDATNLEQLKKVMNGQDRHWHVPAPASHMTIRRGAAHRRWSIQ